MERRNRLLFGICSLLFLAVAFLAVSVWLYVNEAKKLRAERKRTTGRLLVDQVMLIEHWGKLEDREAFRRVVENLTKELTHLDYRWEIIRPESKDTAAGEAFDQKVLNRFSKAELPKKNAYQYAERLVQDGKVYEYYQPVWAEESCVSVCHKPAAEESGGGRGEAGDLMAVVKVSIPNASRRQR